VATVFSAGGASVGATSVGSTSGGASVSETTGGASVATVVGVVVAHADNNTEAIIIYVKQNVFTLHKSLLHTKCYTLIIWSLLFTYWRIHKFTLGISN